MDSIYGPDRQHFLFLSLPFRFGMELLINKFKVSFIFGSGTT